MASLCCELCQSFASAAWHCAQASLPTKFATEAPHGLRASPPPCARRNPRPIARTLSNASAAPIQILRLDKDPPSFPRAAVSCGDSVRAPPMELLRPFLDDFGLLRGMVLVPSDSSFREPGIHNHRQWLWIPALAPVATRPDLAKELILPARSAWGRAQDHCDLHRLAIAPGVEINRRAGCHHGNDVREITRTHQRRAIDRSEHVAFLDMRRRGGAIRPGPLEDGAVRLRHAEALGEWRGHRTDLNAHP